MFGWLTRRSRLTAALQEPHKQPPVAPRNVEQSVAAVVASIDRGISDDWARHQAAAATEYDAYQGGLGHPDMSRDEFIRQRGLQLWKLESGAYNAVSTQRRLEEQRHDDVVERLDAIHAAASRKTPLEQIVDFAKAHPLLAGYVATELLHKARR